MARRWMEGRNSIPFVVFARKVCNQHAIGALALNLNYKCNA